MTNDWGRLTLLSVAALVISIAALIFSVVGIDRHPQDHGVVPTASSQGMLARIERTGVLHAGYGVYPPYTIEDPNTRAVTGFSVEILEQIAKELNCKVVWHRMNWNTMSADLKRGEFDVIADPIFQTIPRAREFGFSEPYAQFSDGIGVVRKGNERFKRIEDVDKENVTIAVGQGWASETLVKARFAKPKVISVQTSTDLLQLFNEVLSGRADIAIADGADALRFVSEHASEASALWVDNPPAYMPAGFAVKHSDTEAAQFLTVSLRNLKATGVIDSLAKKYKLTSMLERRP